MRLKASVLHLFDQQTRARLGGGTTVGGLPLLPPLQMGTADVATKLPGKQATWVFLLMSSFWDWEDVAKRHLENGEKQGRDFLGLWPAGATQGWAGWLHLAQPSGGVGGASARSGAQGRRPYLLAPSPDGFLGLRLRNCSGTASSQSSEQQPGVEVAGPDHLLRLHTKAACL